MIAQKKNLSLDKGATFDQQFRYMADDATPFDLTGWTATFKIYKLGDDATALSEAVCTTDADGWITASFTDEVTATMTLGKKAYGLEITSPDGEIHRLLYGQLDVRGVANV